MTNSVKDEQNVESASATTLKELKDTLWKAADKLRGSMDASQYKDIVLGLVFLKYVTDAFDARRAELRAEGEERGDSESYIQEDLEDIDAYREKNVFWVDRIARWTFLRDNSKGKTADAGQEYQSIGKLIDNAMKYPAHQLRVGQRGSAPFGRTHRLVQHHSLHRGGSRARPRFAG